MAKSKPKLAAEPATLRERVMQSMEVMCPKGSVKVIDDPTIVHWNSTGSPVIDYHIGQGEHRKGFPGGRVVELFGPESGGKTRFAMRCIAACQRIGGYGHFITGEGVDRPFLTNICGVNVDDADRFQLTEASSLEGAAGAIEATIRTFCNADIPCVIVTDSISALGLLADSFQEKGPEESKSSAGEAKFLHQWFRRGFLYYLSGSPITIILIRHTTSAVRQTHGDQTTVTHGKAINYHSWTRLKIWRSKMDKDKEGDMPGYWCNITAIKSKTGVDHWTVRIPMVQGQPPDTGAEVVDFLTQEGVFKTAGSYRTCPLPDGTGVNNYTWKWIELYNTDVGWQEYLDSLVQQHILVTKFPFSSGPVARPAPDDNPFNTLIQ